MESLPNYDAWKTACCNRYPDCADCPYDSDDEDDEYDEDESEQF